MFYNNIETDRLLLKNIAHEDRDFILKQFSDDSINEFLFDAEPMQALDEADELIGFYLQPKPRGQHRWIITLKQTGEKIGTCGFHALDREAKCVDIGYDLQKAFWGKGIMSEAMYAMLGEYLPKLGVKRVYAHIAEGNTRSMRLAERLGFAKSGETETLAFHGRDYLHYIYVLEVNA